METSSFEALLKLQFCGSSTTPKEWQRMFLDMKIFN